MTTESAQFLTTLRRIPDDVILSMATRPIDLRNAYECVCGWAAREAVARERGVSADEFRDTWVVPDLIRLMGGDQREWSRVNGAVENYESGDALEDAFVERVLECVS